MNDLYKESMHAAVDQLYAEKDDVTGVVITSAKKTFFAGGNLKGMLGRHSRRRRRRSSRCARPSRPTCAGWRRSASRSWPPSTAPRSAAASRSRWPATTGSWSTTPRSSSACPRSTLGLLPGGGGVTRTVRMFGIQSALMDILLQGTRFKPAAAKEKGLVDELVADRDDLVPAAKKWINAHQDDPQAASNPWDRDGYKIPGGTPSSPVARRVPAGVPGDAAQADQGRATTRPRGRSWPRRSRVRRSTSTPPAGSSRATSPS